MKYNKNKKILLRVIKINFNWLEFSFEIKISIKLLNSIFTVRAKHYCLLCFRPIFFNIWKLVSVNRDTFRKMLRILFRNSSELNTFIELVSVILRGMVTFNLTLQFTKSICSSSSAFFEIDVIRSMQWLSLLKFSIVCLRSRLSKVVLSIICSKEIKHHIGFV